ncbi:MAG: C1 family peptidase [Caldilineae bacterium]|nr:C1 family peptidase [Caldilineae bacterium]
MTTRTPTDRATLAPPEGPRAPEGALTPERIAAARMAFDAEPRNRLMQNAVTQSPLDDVALDRAVVTELDHSYSNLLDDWKVTNQKRSGRCWLFAGLNLLRPGAMRAMRLETFEFSQNHLLFWDKLEKANYFLEAMIELAERPIDDRTLHYLLHRPIDDGGQWNMFVNLVRKHGLVPQAAMPETESSSNTGRMNDLLCHTLRDGARELRTLQAQGASPVELRAAKDARVERVYRMLSIHLGTPPERFDWQWNDKDGAFHRDGSLTPQAFAERYVTLPIEDYVCLVHDPRPESPMGRTFTVEYLGNVAGGEPVVYLNGEIALMKSLASEVIQSGEPVWFGCDVGKMLRRDLGLWDARLFDYEAVYGFDFELDKADRLRYGHAMMTHAMLFTGVDLVEGRPRRWRVENSWGEDGGRKGFYAMNDSWFDEHMLEIAVHRDRLPDALRAALDAEPIRLPAWDPMGSLA